MLHLLTSEALSIICDGERSTRDAQSWSDDSFMGSADSQLDPKIHRTNMNGTTHNLGEGDSSCLKSASHPSRLAHRLTQLQPTQQQDLAIPAAPDLIPVDVVRCPEQKHDMQETYAGESALDDCAAVDPDASDYASDASSSSMGTPAPNSLASGRVTVGAWANTIYSSVHVVAQEQNNASWSTDSHGAHSLLRCRFDLLMRENTPTSELKAPHPQRMNQRDWDGLKSRMTPVAVSATQAPAPAPDPPSALQQRSARRGSVVSSVDVKQLADELNMRRLNGYLEVKPEMKMQDSGDSMRRNMPHKAPNKSRSAILREEHERQRQQSILRNRKEQNLKAKQEELVRKQVAARSHLDQLNRQRAEAMAATAIPVCEMMDDAKWIKEDHRTPHLTSTEKVLAAQEVAAQLVHQQGPPKGAWPCFVCLWPNDGEENGNQDPLYDLEVCFADHGLTPAPPSAAQHAIT